MNYTCQNVEFKINSPSLQQQCPHDSAATSLPCMRGARSTPSPFLICCWKREDHDIYSKDNKINIDVELAIARAVARV
jgi:hypothetical protein